MQLEGYSDLSPISMGGVTTVYKARGEAINRIVAIKFFTAGYRLDEEDTAIFEAELQSMARLDHPNIVKIIDHGVKDGAPYLVMLYERGRSLMQMIGQLDGTSTPALHWMLQIAQGVNFAHRNGLLHRNLNPDNILIGDDDHVSIMGFVGGWIEAHGADEADTVIGGPDFLSPEASRDPLHVDERSDIYSLGAIMYACFSGLSPREYQDYTRDGLDELADELTLLIRSCLQQEPDLRPQSANDVVNALQRILRGDHLKKEDREEAEAMLGPWIESFDVLDIVQQNAYGSSYLYGEKSGDVLLLGKRRVGTHAGLRQAKQLQHVDYKNLVKIVGLSTKRDTFNVVMEYMGGGSLKDRLAKAWSKQDFLPSALEICYAMNRAHELGVLHGNLRPSNILFDRHGHIKVSDFGYNKHYIGHEKRDWYQPQSRLDPSVSRDLYSAGAIFYHMLTGCLPQVSFGLLVNCDAFKTLDKQLQDLVRGMIENQATGYFSSFREVIDVLNDLRLGLNPDPSARLQRAAQQKLLAKWIPLGLFGVIVAIALVSYFFIA